MPAYTLRRNATEIIDGSNLFFIRRMKETFAQPSLILDQQDRMWLIKPWISKVSNNALANEMLGSQLCDAIGLPGPECKIILIKDQFFENPETWVENTRGVIKPDPGLHLASRYFPDSDNTEVMEFLPPTLRHLFANRQDCLGMFIFDAWAIHADRRQALFYERSGKMYASFIDHSHLFGGPWWAQEGRCFAPANFVQRVAVEECQDPEVTEWIELMQRVLPQAFNRIVSCIPKHWYCGDISALKEFYLRRLPSLYFIVAELVLLVRDRASKSINAEISLAENPIRLLSQRGTDQWL